MSFWDSSAVVPLFLDQPASSTMRHLERQWGSRVVWWGTLVECQSALEREIRAGDLTGEDRRQAEPVLWRLAEDWFEIQPALSLRERARRLLRFHPLAAADALQLAAALLWSEERPAGRVFVCLDSRLREAAQREGFTVLPESL